jgi:hypothetical protein
MMVFVWASAVSENKQLRPRKESPGRVPAVCLRKKMSVLQAGQSSQFLANTIGFGAHVGQSCNVAESKSAPFGHTMVRTSGSIRTWLKSRESRNAPKSCPRRTGSMLMTCSVLSSNPSFNAWGPTTAALFTKWMVFAFTISKCRFKPHNQSASMNSSRLTPACRNML